MSFTSNPYSHMRLLNVAEWTWTWVCECGEDGLVYGATTSIHSVYRAYASHLLTEHDLTRTQARSLK